ncbi:SDR family NAD(P)-dependent oxidoreductase [Plantactinospora mayteni]|uniref:SDR family NAD(P)-dependent oxidoreductase n=1 Tax=Plantactinospora mayteni TaxID=566021 RepID=UPI0019430EA1|nr:SDR family oxidoreductase [Plantactinospora mayteni]
MTGASSGIGLAVVRRLLTEGWRVTGISRRPPPSTVRHSAETGGSANPRWSWLRVDLTDLDALGQTLTTVSGGVNAIVHSAGLQRTARLGALDPADAAAMWQVNVAAASHLVNALSGQLVPGGRVVLIGSRTREGAAGKSHYAATKAALVGLSRSWAMELLPRGITVNVVAPGPTDSPMLNDPARSGTPPKVPPLGRLIRPEEVAGLVTFLLGPDAGAITGQHLVICGGASLSWLPD